MSPCGDKCHLYDNNCLCIVYIILKFGFSCLFYPAHIYAYFSTVKYDTYMASKSHGEAPSSREVIC